MYLFWYSSNIFKHSHLSGVIIRREHLATFHLAISMRGQLKINKIQRNNFCDGHCVLSYTVGKTSSVSLITHTHTHTQNLSLSKIIGGGGGGGGHPTPSHPFILQNCVFDE